MSDRKEFLYLNRLRASGIVNMFGATPYLQEAYSNLTAEQARNVLAEWMKWVATNPDNLNK
jgi:hypothetical protein